MAVHYDPAASQADIAALHFAWGDRQAAASSPKPRTAPSVTGARPLRIGYVSPDFRAHPLGWFLLGVIPNHTLRVEVFCYYDKSAEDDVTRRLRAGAKVWREVAGAPHEALARMIAADGINLLVDLSGHFENNRMPVFAMRPAAR